tara:strand:+ start:2227 stop:3132 length:906 start_codon:yes stop_codon:yes gene_type:complete
MSIVLRHEDGLRFLESIPDDSVDLILTDPPYITSRDSGMDKWVDHVAKQDSENSVNIMTEEQWQDYKTAEEWDTWFDNSKIEGYKRLKELKKMKASFLKYGSIYGKKYAVKTNYGSWDSEFTLEKLQLFINHFYRVLRPGGTCIVFFDIWKITNLKDMLEAKNDKDKPTMFKQIRFIEWIKTNPQPINSKVNYLTNCREIALLGIKKSKPTFNSKYDNGIYCHPIQGGKNRFHPTQKSLPLFEELIKKHSNEGDLVLDCFAGSATTAIAAMNNGRNFVGCELDEEYCQKSVERISRNSLDT